MTSSCRTPPPLLSPSSFFWQEFGLVVTQQEVYSQGRNLSDSSLTAPSHYFFSFTFRSLNLHENRNDFKIKTSLDGSIVKFIGTILNWLGAGGEILFFFFFCFFYSFFLCLYCSISYPHRLLISSIFFVVPPSLVSIFSFLPHLMLFSSIHYLPDYVSTILCPSQGPSSSLLLLTPSFSSSYFVSHLHLFGLPRIIVRSLNQNPAGENPKTCDGHFFRRQILQASERLTIREIAIAEKRD